MTLAMCFYSYSGSIVYPEYAGIPTDHAIYADEKNRDGFEYYEYEDESYHTVKERLDSFIASGREVPWIDDSFMSSLPYIKGMKHHFVRPAESDPAKLAYFQTWDHFMAGRLSVIKPGRYLQKYYGHVLSADDIKKWADAWRKELATPETLQFAKTPEEFARIYRMTASFGSCMQKRFDLGEAQRHPAEAYAAGDLELAYIIKNDSLVARCLIWRDAPSNGEYSEYRNADGDTDESRYVRVGRVYGDEVRIQQSLRKFGIYTSSTNAYFDTMEGARMLAIEIPNYRGFSVNKPYTAYLLPYVDGSACRLRFDGDSFILQKHRSDSFFVAQNTCGYCTIIKCLISGRVGENSSDFCYVYSTHSGDVVGAIHEGVYEDEIESAGYIEYNGSWYTPDSEFITCYSLDLEEITIPANVETWESLSGRVFSDSVVPMPIDGGCIAIAEAEEFGYTVSYNGELILADTAVEIDGLYYSPEHVALKFYAHEGEYYRYRYVEPGENNDVFSVVKYYKEMGDLLREWCPNYMRENSDRVYITQDIAQKIYSDRLFSRFSSEGRSGYSMDLQSTRIEKVKGILQHMEISVPGEFQQR